MSKPTFPPTWYPTEYPEDKTQLFDDDDDYDDDDDDQDDLITVGDDDAVDDDAVDDDYVAKLIDEINNRQYDDDLIDDVNVYDDDDYDDDNKDDDNPYYYEADDDDLGFVDDDIATFVVPTMPPKTMSPTMPPATKPKSTEEPTMFPTEMPTGHEPCCDDDDKVEEAEDKPVGILPGENIPSPNTNNNGGDVVIIREPSLSDEIKYAAIGGGIASVLLSVVVFCIYMKCCRTRKGKSAPVEERHSLNASDHPQVMNGDSFQDELPNGTAENGTSWASTGSNGGLDSPTESEAGLLGSPNGFTGAMPEPIRTKNMV